MVNADVAVTGSPFEAVATAVGGGNVLRFIGPVVCGTTVVAGTVGVGVVGCVVAAAVRPVADGWALVADACVVLLVIMLASAGTSVAAAIAAALVPWRVVA